MSKYNPYFRTPPSSPQGVSRLSNFVRSATRAASVGIGGMAYYGRRGGQRIGRRTRLRRGRSYTNTKYKRKNTRDNITTAQFDFKTQYVKKRMPRGKKRSWIKSLKKNLAMDLSSLGVKTVVYNSQINRLTPASPLQIGQNFMDFALYGFHGSDDSPFIRAGFKDLFKIFKNDPQIVKDGSGNPESGKLIFKSAVLDVTLKNTGTSDLEVDVYFGQHYKDAPAEVDDLVDGLLTGSTPVINAGNTTLQLTDRGVTPFELTRQIGLNRWTIMKKQKLSLPVGKSVFIQHRDAGNHVISYENLLQYPNTDIAQATYAIKKLTYDVLVIFKPTAGHNAAEQAYELSAGVTRKYSYTYIENNTDYNAKAP